MEPFAACFAGSRRLVWLLFFRAKYNPPVGEAELFWVRVIAAFGTYAVWPTYTGTGTVLLEASFGGFHIFDLNGETWILDSGSYWASEGSVRVSAIRERAWTSFWAGEGLIDWQTKVAGIGKVVLASRGPVEEVALERDKRFVANGKYVIARTQDVTYAIRRPAPSLLKSYLAREGYCRTYDGPGRLLVSSVPYWRYRLFDEKPELAHSAAAAAM